MGTPQMKLETCKEVVDCVQKCVDDGFILDGSPSAFNEAARRLGQDDGKLRKRYRRAWTLYGLKAVHREPIVEAFAEQQAPKENLSELIRHQMVSSPRTIAEMAAKMRSSAEHIVEAIESLQLLGVQITRVGDRYSIPRQAPLAFMSGECLEFVSDKNNLFKFGAVGDNHCGSKHERRDVFADLYDRFERAGMTHVFHTGNWIDGEFRFNKHDLLVHGIEQQCRMLADTYPQRNGITTYAVWGDDHEGWYAQREGIDVGTYGENVMHSAGREDWKNLGFMEAHVKLVNANTGVFSMMSVVHPGGGSSYALSYAIQKIIEALEGGEKPAVGLYGHYHKLWAGNIRNVWCVQTGTGMDQGTFMRKNKIEAHVGGVLVTLEQDPESGAIVGFLPDMKRYFTKGYYENRWSHHGPVVQAPRTVGGI